MRTISAFPLSPKSELGMTWRPIWNATLKHSGWRGQSHRYPFSLSRRIYSFTKRIKRRMLITTAYTCHDLGPLSLYLCLSTSLVVLGEGKMTTLHPLLENCLLHADLKFHKYNLWNDTVTTTFKNIFAEQSPITLLWDEQTYSSVSNCCRLSVPGWITSLYSLGTRALSKSPENHLSVCSGTWGLLHPEGQEDMNKWDRSLSV